MTSWSVCSTVKEPQAVLDRFVRHHLDMGASYVHLFFDDPDDTVFSHFVNQPGVKAQRCTPAYWDRLNRRRPPFQERRQKLNAALAYQTCQTDWQTHIDADELILPARIQTISQELSSVDPAFETAKTDTIEPLHCPEAVPGQMTFKKSGRNKRHRTLERLYGRFNPMLNHGLMGHCHGKSFLRSGLSGWSHGIHRPTPPQGQNRNAVTLDGARLAHLHCLSRVDWMARVIRKSKDPLYSSGGAFPLIRQIRACHGEAAEKLSDARILGLFFDRVNLFGGKLQRRLERAELVETHAINETAWALEPAQEPARVAA